MRYLPRVLRYLRPHWRAALVSFAATVLVFIFSLGFYVTPAILGGGRTLMIAEYIKLQILDLIRWGLGTMMASTLLIAVVLLLAVFSRIVDFRRLFGSGA